MAEKTLGVVESKFADIIWSREPISSSELSQLAQEELGWKKTTSFTVLKRLCNKGLFVNENGVVTSLISKNDFYSLQSERFVEETFQGSLPAFLAAFAGRKKLSKEQIAELKKFVAEYEEE